MKRPTFQVIVDLHGEAIFEQHLYYLLNCVQAIKGAEDTSNGFWATRSDLLHDLLGRYTGTRDLRKDMCSDRLHEPSFDYYLRTSDLEPPTPIGRIINVKIPEWPR